MSPSAVAAVRELTPELKALVEQGVVTSEQAQEAMAAAPAPNELTGVARCVGLGSVKRACEMLDASRPIRLRRVFMQSWAPDLPILLGQTEHFEVLTEGDDLCPGCGGSCSISPEEPPEYPSQGF